MSKSTLRPAQGKTIKERIEEITEGTANTEWGLSIAVNYNKLRDLIISISLDIINSAPVEERVWGSNGGKHEDQCVSDSLYFKQLRVRGYNHHVQEVKRWQEKVKKEVK
jgi:hypothetical protein